MEPHDASAVLPDLPILFVDDEPEVLKALMRTIQHHGWPAMSASGPLEALRMLEAQEFAAVVSDYRMPRMDGVEFLARVREQWPESERLLLTAYADEGALERGINEAGISRFLRKPWKRDILISVLGQVLKESRIRREHAVFAERLRYRNEELSYVNRLLQTKVEEGDRAITSFRRRWDVALNAISDPVIIVAPDRRLEGGNKATADLAGVAVEELEGRKCHSTLFGFQKPCVGCPLATGSGRITVTRAEGESFFDARAYRLPGQGESHLCSYRDITRSVSFEAETAQMEKMAAIGRLAGSVAHEINNPLHGVLSFVQLAQKPAVAPDKLARYHEVIYECAIRCRDIVHTLRDFSRQARPADLQRVDVSDVIKRSLVLFGSVGGVTIRQRLEAPDPCCMGNGNQLQQVIVNLVQNAVDASPKGGVIEIALVHDGEQLVLSVEDEGRGVPVEIREKIFEPFFTTKPEGVGTGLGLAISHKIVREHEGTLRVGTAVTLGGARFEARLPLATAAAGSTAGAREASETSPTSATSLASPTSHASQMPASLTSRATHTSDTSDTSQNSTMGQSHGDETTGNASASSHPRR